MDRKTVVKHNRDEMMYFCPKCGSIMIVRGDSLSCPRCGNRRKLESFDIQHFKRSTYFAKVHEKKIDVEGIGVPASAILDDRISCPKCGYRGVYYWRRHRSSAESSDIIEKMYRCKSCGYSWSELE